MIVRVLMAFEFHHVKMGALNFKCFPTVGGIVRDKQLSRDDLEVVSASLIMIGHDILHRFLCHRFPSVYT